MLLKWAYGRQRCMECVRIHISFGILRPLANPETLKNLPMCKFEEKKTAYGNGHFFKQVWKNTPNTHPNTPRRGRRGVQGVGIWGSFPNLFEKVSVSMGWFFKIAHRQVFQDLLRDAECQSRR